MAVLEQLKSCSYRGVSFYYQSTSESGGFKTAEHLYPGSDNFRVEQLGNAPRRFDIEARVTFDNRDAFDAALNTSGTGLLSHPMIGNFLVKVTQYTKDDSTDQLGLYSYRIQFVVELGLIVPTVESITTAVISTLRSSVFTNIKDYVDENVSFVKEVPGI